MVGGGGRVVGVAIKGQKNQSCKTLVNQIYLFRGQWAPPSHTAPSPAPHTFLMMLIMALYHELGKEERRGCREGSIERQNESLEY